MQRCRAAAAQADDSAEWKAVLSDAQQLERLSKGRKPLRKLMLQLYGDHSAYHDARAHTRLVQAHQVKELATACIKTLQRNGSVH